MDKLGIKLGYLPPKLPFSMSYTPIVDKHSEMAMSKSELTTALKDKETFLDLYVRVTNKAIDMYTKAGRRKFALRLHESLAALDM